MNEPRYRRDVIEFIIGPPDKAATVQAAEELRWSCGCHAIQDAEGTFAIEPCAEHRSEFDEAG